jgi:hypothetical protein
VALGYPFFVEANSRQGALIARAGNENIQLAAVVQPADLDEMTGDSLDEADIHMMLAVINLNRNAVLHMIEELLCSIEDLAEPVHKQPSRGDYLRFFGLWADEPALN